MDEVFRALADPGRRLLLDRLSLRNGQTLRELGIGLEMSRQAVSKHLAVLESARLVTTVRRGREKLHYLDAAPIGEITDRWIRQYDQARVRALADLKSALEDTMDRRTFVHTSYIRTTPERLWAALTESAFTWRYWQSTFETDWTPGSPVVWHAGGVAISAPEQVVLESDPPRRLAYTWHTFTPEWAAAVGVDEAVRARLAAEPRSRVAFELEPDGPLVKLTVVHDDLDPDGTMITMISEGWPQVVGGLKTLLEAGGTDEEGFAEQVTVDAPPERVLAALTTVDGLAGWWASDISGSPATGGTLKGRGIVMRVDHVDAGLVAWTCTSGGTGWTGTSVWFDLRGRPGGGTAITVRHVGLTPELPGFAESRARWEQDLRRLAASVDDPAVVGG